MKLHDFIATVPSLSKEDCGNLIAFFEENSEHHIRNDNQVQHFTELNVNSVSPKLSDLLVRKLITVIDTYIDVHCPTGDRFFPGKYRFEEFRIKRYNDKDCFKQHVDVGDSNSAKRFLAFLFYLNDDFDGGSTVFKTPDKKIIQPIGWRKFYSCCVSKKSPTGSKAKALLGKAYAAHLNNRLTGGMFDDVHEGRGRQTYIKGSACDLLMNKYCTVCP